MKKIVLFLLIGTLNTALAQSVTISPTNDEHIITNYGTSSFPNIVGRSSGGTATSPTATPANNLLLIMGGRGHNGTNFNSSNSASIGFYANQQFSPTTNGTHIRFFTTSDNSATILERMRINDDGNVGIGTTAPTSNLHIYESTASTSSKLTLSNLSQPSSSTYLSHTHSDGATLIYNNGGGGMSLYSPANITLNGGSGGNVGIGTPTPLKKLHVANGSSGRSPNTNTSVFIEKNGHNYLELATPDTGERGIMFSNPTDGNSGGIYYYNKDMYFNTNSNDRRMSILANGNVGIGTNTPTAKLHVDGDFALKKKVLLSGNGGHSNFDREGASIISIATPANGGGGETLGGIADGVDGLIVHVYPVQGTSITLAHENTGSLAANRIITQTAANVSITSRGGATLMYDASVSRWRVIGIAN